METSATGAQTSDGARPAKFTPRMGRAARSASMPLLLVLLALTLSLTSSSFLTVSNLATILGNASVAGILAIGMTFVLLVGGIDLSVGSTATLATVMLTQSTQSWQLPSGVAIVIAIAIGCLVGLANGAIVVHASVPPIIVTLGSLSIVEAIAEYLSGGQQQSLVSYPAITYIGQASVGQIPVSGLVFLALGACAQLVIVKTIYCRQLTAIGGNRRAAHLMGLPVRTRTISVYVISGALASVAGIVIAGQLAGSSANAGYGLELPAIAAAVLGGTSLFGGSATALGTVVGALLLSTVFDGLILLGVASYYYQQVVTGAVLAAAVALNEVIRRRAT